jgi:hypothetical protein
MNIGWQTRKLIAALLLILGTATGLMAEGPLEINARGGVAAVGLLAGAVLIVRGRRKNKANGGGLCL